MIINLGPSGVRALPLAAGINEGGHYFGPSVLRAPAEQLRWQLFLVINLFLVVILLLFMPPLIKGLV